MSIVSVRVSKWSSIVVLSSLALLRAGEARAGDKALAESLFDAGRQLMQAGNYDQACPKFAESQRQDPSSGTLINLAKCYEALGRSASAWAEYKEAATLARTMGRDSQAEFADQGARRLEGTLSKLRVDGPLQAPPGLVVTRDGVELGAGSLGIPIAVDPGEHAIEARALGYKPWSGKVTLKPQADAQTVQIPALEALPAAPVAPLPAATPSVAAAPAPHAAGADSGSHSERNGSNATLGYVIGGAGVLGLGVGTVFALMAKSQANSAQNDPALCPQKLCSKAGRAEINAAESKAMVANVGFGLGLVGVGVGLYFIVSGHDAPRASAAARVTPWVTHDTAGLGYSGAF